MFVVHAVKILPVKMNWFSLISEKQIPLRLNYSKYCEAITEDNLIKLVALLIDYETKDAMLAVRDIYLENPEIKIKVDAL